MQARSPFPDAWRIMSGDKDNAGVRAQLHHFLDRGKSIHRFEPHIHDDNIRAVEGKLIHRFLPV